MKFSTGDCPTKVREKFESFGQEDIFRFWETLSGSEKDHLINQLISIDLGECSRALDDIARPMNANGQISPPSGVIKRDQSGADMADYNQLGEELLSQGKVAAFTVAGGQGSRLGHDGPKGTFACGPITGNTLFQHFAESLIFYSKKFSISPLWLVMTSPSNHSQTCEYFKKSNFFGLPKNRVKIFSQGTLPVFNEKGKFILESKFKIATSPNGHGGSLQALEVSGCLELMKEEGVDFLSYFQVDNPLVYCLDPTFIGLHASQNADMSSKAVSKENAEEKVGIFIEESERLRVLEYSDLPNNLINAKDKNGFLKFDLGNIAIHMFSRDFIEKLTRALPQSKRLPYHAAHKKVPYIDEKGRLRAPNQPNGIKAEMFVFDALPLAQNNQILKVSRSEEFAPIKNAFGADSIKSSIKLQLARSQVWQGAVGGTRLKGDVEISPLYAPTQAYFIEEYTRGTSFNLKKTNKGTLWRPTP